jgi:hypothetical protein
MIEKLMCSLQKKFHYVVVVIEESQNINVLSIQGFIEKLQAHEKRVNEIQEVVGAQALFFRTRWFWIFTRGRGRR